MSTRPILVTDPSPFIERAYKQTKPWQWVREAFRNSWESFSNVPASTKKRISLETEPESIDSGFYRYAVYDNGCGIGRDEFDHFIMTYGGGGKPIGEAWENFGIGMKCCLLPWNRYGLVVISLKDGVASMIWMEGTTTRKGERTQIVYGCRQWGTDEGSVSVITPFETAGVNFENVIPEWIGKKVSEDTWVAPDGSPAHGTILILMGNNKDQDTIYGDPTRREAMGEIGPDGVQRRTYWPEHMFIEERFWNFPADIDVSVRMPNNVDRSKWPKSKLEWKLPSVEGKKITQRRECRGAKNWISHPYGLDVSGIPPVLSGCVDVSTPFPAKIYWFLRDENFPKDHWHKGKSLGYIAALYDNELYERAYSKEDGKGITSRYNKFGIYHSEIQRRLFLVVEPKPISSSGDTDGVYPMDARSHLACNYDNKTASELPWEEWAAEFRDKMPEAISEAEHRLEHNVSADDISISEECKKRVAQYGDRFMVERPFVRSGLEDGPVSDLNLLLGKQTTERPRVPKSPRRPKPSAPPTNDPWMPAIKGGDMTGIMRKVKAKIPTPHWRPSSEFESPWVFARWDQERFEVSLNEDHPVYKDVIAFACDKYNVSREEASKAVRLSFGTSACTKVAHCFGLKPILNPTPDENGLVSKTTDDIVKDMLSTEALTLSLLGFHDIENEMHRAFRGLRRT